MSIKRMVTKLALAFAAKKGLDVVRGMGGISGVKSAINGNTTSAQASSAGGIGGILSSLGGSGAATGSIGGMLGSLATAFGGQSGTDELDAQFAQSEPVGDDEAGPVLRAMVQMARADGSIDEDEQAALFDILDDASPDEKAILTAALREPVDPRALAQDTPPHASKEVYSAALLIGKPDTASERAFLQTLARELRLDQNSLDTLHRAMGKPQMHLS